MYLISIMMHTTWKQICTTFNDAYNMEADIHDLHYFYVFLVYEIKAYAKTEHWERIYLISNWAGEKENKYRGICFLPDKKNTSYTRSRRCRFR